MSYLFIQSSFVVLSIACIALVIYGLRFGLKPESAQNHQKVIFTVFIIILVWLSMISLLSYSGFLSDFSTIPPRVMIVILPPLVLLIVLSRKKSISNLLKNIPITWLLYLQSFRFFVEVLLWGLYELDLIPIQMTFEGRNFDIIVGITAPAIAILYQKGFVKELALKVWNIIGLLILANIVITAILSMPLPIRVFMNDPNSAQVMMFPIVWLPGVLVPLAYYLHIFSLMQIRDRSTSL